MNRDFGIPIPRTERGLAIVVIVASALVLIGAYTMSGLWDIRPCSLCTYQRWVYVATFMVAVAAAVTHGGRTTTHGLLALVIVCFLVGVGIAVFHTGVEHHWWSSGEVCEGVMSGPLDITQLQQQLQNLKPSPPCDEVQWRFLGLFSFAEINIVLSLALAAWTGRGLAALRRA